MNLYLGSGLWKKEGWLNHGTTKSLWYNNLVMVQKLSTNIGTIKSSPICISKTPKTLSTNIGTIKSSDICISKTSKKYNLSKKFKYDIDHDLFSNKPLPIKDNSLKTILVGPEGDFTQEEVDFALKNDIYEISLGDSILRTETAGVVACNLINIVQSIK